MAEAGAGAGTGTGTGTAGTGAGTSYKAACSFTGTKELSDICASIPLSTFPQPKDGVVIIDSTATVEDAVRILTEKNILSAPVRDVSQPDDADWSDKYLGLVDMTDIVYYLLDALKGKYDGRPSFMESLSSHSVLSKTKVTEVMHVFKFGPFVPLPLEDSTFLDAMLILGKHGLHRLCVVKLGGDIVNIITQSALVGVLSMALPRLEAVGKKTLSELGLAGEDRPVVTVSIDDCCVNALQLMREHNISAVPIVGADGAMVGVFSNHDVRLLFKRPSYYPRVFQTLREFMAAKVSHEVDAHMPVIAVNPSDTLEATVRKLESLHLHRLFIQSSTGIPVGVVSLTDVLSVVVEEPTDYFGDYFDA